MTRAWLVRQPALNPHLDKGNKKNTPNVISQNSWMTTGQNVLESSKCIFVWFLNLHLQHSHFSFLQQKQKKQKFIEFFQNWRRNNRRINNSNNNNWNWNPYVLDSVVVFQLRVEGVVITLSLSQTVSQSVWQASRVIQGDQHHWWNCTHTLFLQLLNGWNANHSLDRIYSFIHPFRESCQ